MLVADVSVVDVVVNDVVVCVVVVVDDGLCVGCHKAIQKCRKTLKCIKNEKGRLGCTRCITY